MAGHDFLLMDGSSILVRAYFASARPGRRLLQSSQGVYTNAVVGFLNMMFGALTQFRPEYLFVAWDVSRETFRRQLYPQYKGTRGELPEALHQQFTTMKQVLAAFGVSQYFHETYEADDLIGTLAVQAAEDGHNVTILTGDHDALQLVNSRVTVAIMKKGVTEMQFFTPQTLKEESGLSPYQITDLKGLMGDTSDNIPGVPGVGEKTAKRLLAEYETVENLIAHCDSLKGKLHDKIKEHQDMALMSKKLATIITNVPLPQPLSSHRLEFDMATARTKLAELDLQRLMLQLERVCAS